MSKYIDTNEAKALADDIVKMAPFMGKTMKMICEFIEGVPSADVAPIVHAHWIKMIEMSDVYDIYYVCSNCKEELERVALRNSTIEHPYGEYKSIEPTKYCPHCGAIMDEKETEK